MKNMNNYIRSETTGRLYDPKTVVRILNLEQAAAYFEHGLQLLDVYPSRNYNTGKRCWVFLFDRESSKEAYDLWCRYELGSNDSNE